MMRLSVPLFAKPKSEEDLAGGGNQAAVATKFVTVKVLCPAIGEEGQTHLFGETFQCSAARAAAIGTDHVEVIG